MTITDKRGRRKGGADPRVSEAAKADMPAYGFDGMTVGEIMDLRKERLKREREEKNQKAAEGKTRLTVQDKKY